MSQATVVRRLRDPAAKKMSFEEVEKIVEESRVGNHDALVPLRKVRLVPATGEAKDGVGNMLEVGDQIYDFTPRSWSQFCGRVGVPAKYADTVDADERKHLFDYWTKREPDNRMMVRLRSVEDKKKGTTQHTVRAVLDPKTTRFDHHVLLQHLKPFVERESLCVLSLHFDEAGMRLAVGAMEAFSSNGQLTEISRMAKISIKGGGDPLMFGMQVSNSEVAEYDFEVSQMVLRLLCTNGMIGWSPKAVYKQSRQYGDILAFRGACSDAYREMRTEQVRAVRYYRESRNVSYERPKHEGVLRALFRNYGLSGGGDLDDVLLLWEQHPSGNPALKRRTVRVFP